MALKTVGELKSSVAGLLQGTSLNNVTDLNGALERAARTTVQQADIPEASGRENYMLYDGVYDYPAPEFIFGGAIVDLRPQAVDRSPWDYTYKKPVEMFDRTKHFLPSGVMVTFESNKGEGIMRVAQTQAKPKKEIDGMDDSADWTNGGSAGTIAEDETVYYHEPASLRFTLTGASSGYIEKTLDNAIDLSDYQGVGVCFLAIYTPSASNLTNLIIRIGSDSSNYTSVTETEGFLGAWTANEWTLVAFDLSAGTDTGTPNYAAIDYVRVTATHAATLTNFRVGDLFIALPSPYTLLYQSSAIFKASGALSNTITGDGDELVLNDAAYTLYEHECALTIALQMGGTLASGLVQSLRAILHGSGSDIGLYALYRGDNPSQEIRMTGNWYND